jgi:hypothetical protein
VKKYAPTVVIFEISKDHPGKLINAQPLLKLTKKRFPTVVIFSVLKDHSGKLINAHESLKK